MNAWDTIRNRARADLIVTTRQGDQDVFLWEHTLRVAATARRMLTLSQVRDAEPNEEVLAAAAMYHDAGWIARIRDGEVAREEIRIRPISPAHYELGAMMLERSLARVLARDPLGRAAGAIRDLGGREPTLIESRVIAEADHLEEFGLISLWTAIRRGTVDGKGIQAAIDTWRRRKEYHFWEARLNDSFQFPAIRAVAERRLARFEEFMKQVEIEARGDDILSDAVPSSGARSG